MLITCDGSGHTRIHTYDAAGNCTSTILRRSDGTGMYLKTSATYTSDKNLTASVTDANGSKVSYTYDSLDKVYSAAWTATVNGASTVVTKYTSRSFESGREMTSYIGNVVSLRYAYTRGLLSDVVRHSATGADTWQRCHLAQDALFFSIRCFWGGRPGRNRVC